VVWRRNSSTSRRVRVESHFLYRGGRVLWQDITDSPIPVSAWSGILGRFEEAKNTGIRVGKVRDREGWRDSCDLRNPGGKIMKKILGISMAAAIAILFTASASYAEKRPHAGKILRIETVEKSVDVGNERIGNVERSMLVQGENGDQWTLLWDDTTKFKHGLAPSELREGDRIHFEFIEKNGKMWVTELRRTRKAERD
jgi:Cu/Ag efflux protein CusF